MIFSKKFKETNKIKILFFAFAICILNISTNSLKQSTSAISTNTGTTKVKSIALQNAIAAAQGILNADAQADALNGGKAVSDSKSQINSLAKAKGLLPEILKLSPQSDDNIHLGGPLDECSIPKPLKKGKVATKLKKIPVYKISPEVDVVSVPVAVDIPTDAGVAETNEPVELAPTIESKTTRVRVTWFNTKLKAKDIGANSQGELYAVGVDGNLYKYEFLLDSFIHMKGDFELTKISRVDVSWDGIPYVITEVGDTLYLSCDHKWMRLPGCATDIGIGRGGEIYKTGCDQRDLGFGVYRLVCNCPSRSCYKGCQNWRKPCLFCFSFKEDDRTCSWFRIEGNGVKIDVAPSGNPYVINTLGEISQYDGTNWKKIKSVKAIDLTLSNEGVLLIVSDDNKIYKSVNEAFDLWMMLSGNAESITSGPFSQPWVVRQTDSSVLSSSKFEYN